MEITQSVMRSIMESIVGASVVTQETLMSSAVANWVADPMMNAAQVQRVSMENVSPLASAEITPYARSTITSPLASAHLDILELRLWDVRLHLIRVSRTHAESMHSVS